MTHYADALLLLILVLDLYLIATSRLAVCVQASAGQGLILAAIPLALSGAPLQPHGLAISAGTLALKALLIPWLLMRAIRAANARREVEPFVSLHTSVLIGALLVGLAFWLSRQLVMPRPPKSALLVPVAFSAILLGFFVIVSRLKAVTQVLGYLMMENGVYLFGMGLAREMPFVVELGILLDVLVGVFVFGIVIHHISSEFDHIDTTALSTLKH